MAMMRWTFSDLYTRMGDGQASTPTASQITAFKVAINEGYLRVLNAFNWSFLRQQASMSIDADNNGVDALPAAFGTMLDDPIITTTGYERTLERRTISELEHMQAQDVLVGATPRYYAVRPQTFSSTTGTRHELLLWPLPTSDLTLSISYLFEPSALSGDNDYPMGGSGFGPLILAAAQAEEELNNNKTVGAKAQKYDRLLQEQIIRDGQNHPPVVRTRPVTAREHIADDTWTYET